LNKNVVILKSEAQIDNLRSANRIVAEVLAVLKDQAAAGMSTLDLDKLAMDMCRKHKVKPAFMGLYGFPRSLCVSLNSEVVHGIPSAKRLLADGDIVSVDFGVIFEGMYGDAAISFGIGKVSDQAARLMKVTEASLYCGIDAARVGNRIPDISRAVQEHVERAGFSVVRDFVGHGVGIGPHEPPQIPNFLGRSTPNLRLKAGMTLALEPMVNAGHWGVRVSDDGWTAVTEDGSLSAHFEHSIVITDDGPEILSKL
jgi:methionyl aminopeptidase